jgi:hypothetical protein
MAANSGNRTPFDNDLIHDPTAPRQTQPLPPTPQNVSQGAATNTHDPSLPPGNWAPPFAPPARPTASHLPPQVVPNRSNPTTGSLSSTRRVPVGVLAGLAAVGGAIGVIVLSSMFRSAAPRPNVVGVITSEEEQARQTQARQQTRPTPAPKIIIGEPRAGSKTEIIVPDDADAPTNANTLVNDRPSDVASDDVTPNDTRSNDADSETVVRNPSPPARERRTPNSAVAAVPDASEADLPVRSTDNDLSEDVTTSSTSNSDDQSDSAGERSSTQGERLSQGARSDSSRNSERAATARYVERRRAYSVEPPAGFTLSRRGRRTLWNGPQGTSFLVEVGPSQGTSPRQGWEDLERSLQKKYGRKYRSRGIRETTVDGRPAAIWEFELDTARGTVRKIDVAVHDRSNGYAVLATAPAERFEEWRPRFETAIRSLRIDSGKPSAKRNEESSTGDSY